MRRERFDVILSSPLPRARQTTDELLQGLASPTPPVEYADELAPGAKPRKLDRRREWAARRTLVYRSSRAPRPSSSPRPRVPPTSCAFFSRAGPIRGGTGPP